MKYNLTEEEKEKIFDLYTNQGFTQKEISNIFNFQTTKPVRRILIEKGYQIKNFDKNDYTNYVVKEHGYPKSKITILEKTNHKNNNGNFLWRCLCECGVIFEDRLDMVKNGKRLSCGCMQGDKGIDLTGQIINYLFVKERTSRPEYAKLKGHYWNCECLLCGKEVIYSTTTLNCGRAFSCGCHRLISRRETWEKNNQKRNIMILNSVFGILHPKEFISGNHKQCGKWKCECECGNKIYATTNELLSGKRISCGCLTISSGEQKVLQILKNNNIIFLQQKTYQDLLSNKNKLLRFDFFLPDYNCCIEFQGQQHYNKDNIYYSEEGIENDNKKREYCKNNNIKLIEIPYWDYNKLDWDYIEERLND